MITKDRKTQSDDYLQYYAGQSPVLTVAAQARLRAAHVAVFGLGRNGVSTVLALNAAGVCRFTGVDPQLIAPEQIGPYWFTLPRDIGTSKAAVVARFLAPRPNLKFHSVVAQAEDDEVESVTKDADLWISCVNSLESRLSLEAKAIRNGKPILQVAAYDGRQQLGGAITLRLPSRPELACFGCFFPDEGTNFERGEGLLSTVTAILGHVAGHLAVILLVKPSDDPIRVNNVFFVDLQKFGMEALRVARRADCKLCGHLPC
jgi:molybdopterin/thiamine biosynthesis adenylyltransferase